MQYKNPLTLPKFLTGLLLALALCIGNTASSQNIKKVKIEEIADYIAKSDHPLVISFWATWCAPCVKEIPYFIEEIKKYKEQNAELILVSLDFADAYPSKIASFVKKNNYEASFFWLNETNADHFCPVIDKKWNGSIPSSLFVNNKKSYRKFYERQLTDRQFAVEMKELVE
jgi:thiol-disulfide isomerase/thioredoxin